MFSRCDVKVGDALWVALYNYTKDNYSIESICEEDEQKFAVLKADENYYRLNISTSEDGVFEFAAEAELLEDYSPEEEPQFDATAVEEYVNSLEQPAEEEEEEKEDEEEKCPECGKPVSECECEDEEEEEKDKIEKYNLDEIQEYVELNEKYSALENDYAEAQATIASMQAQLNELTQFKAAIEKAEKEKMIASFYMLSDEDKAEVVENIDNYSLDDIEAKLSIICVRNKVSFNLDNDRVEEPTTFNVDSSLNDDVPAWVKAIRSVASNM